jgi:hypothetical protein
MSSSGMLRRVALVRVDVSEELSASIIKVLLRSVLRLLVTANAVPISPLQFIIYHSSYRMDVAKTPWPFSPRANYTD